MPFSLRIAFINSSDWIVATEPEKFKTNIKAYVESGGTCNVCKAIRNSFLAAFFSNFSNAKNIVTVCKIQEVANKNRSKTIWTKF